VRVVKGSRYLLFIGIFVYNSKKEVDQMRWLSRLLVIFVICLVAVTLPAVPVQAQGADILLSPDDGVPGEEITVYGYNFTPDRWVDIYYYQNGTRTRVAEVRSDDDGDFHVDFEVPESYTGDHEVLAEDTYDVDASDYFTVEPGLTIDPEEGPVGTTVTVEGHGFAEDEEDIELMYYLNGNDYETVADDIEADEDGWWEVSFQIPSSARGDHDIDAQGADSELRDVEEATFEVMPEISLDTSSGTVGESITITGNGFDGDDSYIKVLFAGEEAETEPEIIRSDENGYWEASFEVPDMPAGTYSVTAEGQSTKKEDVNEWTFTVAPGLVLSPDEGYVGMNLTVTGGGFAPDEYVVIEYDGSEVETTRTNGEGSFEVSFPVPESRHGARQVTAEVGGETEATAIFTMESDAPDIPELISPPDGDRVGFISRVRPTFEWSEVSDDSGVYYSLQIATSANFTATEEFAEPIVSILNIVGTNYTLANTEALPYGTYYWIVQAVDGAENAGKWTAVYSFRAGRLPLWAFIVIMVAVAGGIAAAVYFFLIRKRIYYY
jgi:hypothetical protein